MKTDRKLRQTQSDYEEHHQLDHDVSKSSIPDSVARFIPFPKAFKLLADRLDATQDEMAAWIWQGPEDNGLQAYLSANELNPPPKFFYDNGDGSKNDFDYLSPLMACWFVEKDISNFQPTDRYITGKALIERWNALPGIQPNAFICAKIAESRLWDIHPIYGGTVGSSPDDTGYPPLESGLFLLSQVEQIEAEDFTQEKNTSIAKCKDSVAQETGSGNVASPLKGSYLSTSAPPPLAVFREMDNLRFKEIKIRIDPENFVLRISARGAEVTTSFRAIALFKKNEVTLNKQGKVFMAMANRTFSPEERGALRAVSRLSRSLRVAFDTGDSPFSESTPQFQLSIPKEKEAKRRAARRTRRYDDTKKISKDTTTDAQAFLEAHDPNYNPDDTLYSDDPLL